jgi:hypothetical protein
MNENYTFFVDLDGTIFKWGTNELLPGAMEFLQKIEKDGHKIVITTNRGDARWPVDSLFNKEITLRSLSTLRVPYHEILFNIEGSTIVVNDEGAFSVNIRQDGGFQREYEAINKQINTWQKIRKSVATVVPRSKVPV